MSEGSFDTLKKVSGALGEVKYIIPLSRSRSLKNSMKYAELKNVWGAVGPNLVVKTSDRTDNDKSVRPPTHTPLTSPLVFLT